MCLRLATHYWSKSRRTTFLVVHVKAYANSMSMGVSVRNAVKVSRIDTLHDCLVERGNKGQGQWQVAISNKCPSNRVVNMRCSSSVTQGCGFANPKCITLRARQKLSAKVLQGASLVYLKYLGEVMLVWYAS